MVKTNMEIEQLVVLHSLCQLHIQRDFENRLKVTIQCTCTRGPFYQRALLPQSQTVRELKPYSCISYASFAESSVLRSIFPHFFVTVRTTHENNTQW
jgi:hypothetical protein